MTKYRFYQSHGLSRARRPRGAENPRAAKWSKSREWPDFRGSGQMADRFFQHEPWRTRRGE
jgi:hypothetical protein